MFNYLYFQHIPQTIVGVIFRFLNIEMKVNIITKNVLYRRFINNKPLCDSIGLQWFVFDVLWLHVVAKMNDANLIFMILIRKMTHLSCAPYLDIHPAFMHSIQFNSLTKILRAVTHAYIHTVFILYNSITTKNTKSKNNLCLHSSTKNSFPLWFAYF